MEIEVDCVDRTSHSSNTDKTSEDKFGYNT